MTELAFYQMRFLSLVLSLSPDNEVTARRMPKLQVTENMEIHKLAGSYVYINGAGGV